MASSHTRDYLTCDVCLQLFKKPITLGCGHSFCRECVDKFWESRAGTTACICPSCREVFPQRPQPKKNVILANLVSQMRCVETMEEPRCPEHDKLIQLYCMDDDSLMCLMCMSGEHRRHTVVPLEIAHTELKDALAAMSPRLAESLLRVKSSFQKTQGQIKNVKHSGKLSKEILEKKRKALYQAVDDVVDLMKKRINERQEEKLSCLEQQKQKLQQEIEALQEAGSILQKALHELEAITFLKGYKDLQQRVKSKEAPPPIVPDFSMEEQKLDSLIQLNKGFLKEMQTLAPSTELWEEQQRFNCHTKEEQEEEEQEEEEEEEEEVAGQRLTDPSPLKRLYGQTLSLDPNSAHPQILISPDFRKAMRTVTKQPYPAHLGRFKMQVQVMAKEEFFSGCHYWEVDMTSAHHSRVGLACNDITRKSAGHRSRLGGNKMSWCIMKCKDEYTMWHSRHKVKIPQMNIERLGLYLDYEAGTLSFYGDSHHLHTYRTNFTSPLKPTFGLYYFDDCLQFCEY
uniref:zinc-binding protein A33-like n=1 Tax=Myxine glutinosa TaxID=7769 RepID=UPI00358EBBF7